jgi:hypothetical protein
MKMLWQVPKRVFQRSHGVHVPAVREYQNKVGEKLRVVAQQLRHRIGTSRLSGLPKLLLALRLREEARCQ